MGWLFWEIAQAPPDVFANIRTEVLRESPTEGDEHLSFEALARLKYCTACVRETIRLHPSVPSDPKTAFSDDVLPDGTLVFKGEVVAYQPYAMARDTGLWGVCAAEWRPERWLEMENEPSPYLYSSFQAGPRICLGRNMAVLEVKAVLAQVVRSGLCWKVDKAYVPIFR